MFRFWAISFHQRGYPLRLPAVGTFRSGSDIDLVLIGETWSEDYYAILQDLDDLMLPYTMDFSRYSTIKNQNLIDHIERDGVVFYKRNKVLQ